MALEVADISENSLNVVAPTVYVDSVELNGNFAKVYFSLENDSTNWIIDNNTLSNYYLYMSVADQSKNALLATIKNSSKNKTDKLNGFFEFDLSKIKSFDVSNSVINITSSFEQQTVSSTTTLTTIETIPSGVAQPSILIKAFCGNKELSGPQLIEPIYVSGSIPESKFNNFSFPYVSKIKDLNLLSENFTASTGSAPEELSPLFDPELLSSVTIDKKASVGVVFNLLTYLENYSQIYKKIKNYKIFADVVLRNSSINVDKTIFYKRNYSQSKKDFISFANKTNVLKIDDSGFNYLISATDKASDPEDRSNYGIKVKVSVNDYSEIYLKNVLLKEIIEARKLIKNYKEKIIELQKNSVLENAFEFYFENEFEDKITNFQNAINYLTVGSLTAKAGTEKEYLTLFFSLLHPLTTNSELLERLFKYCLSLEKFFTDLFFDTSTNDAFSNNFYSKAVEFVEYDYSKGDKISYSFDYDYNCGYEVILNETKEARQQRQYNGFLTISPDELLARQNLEALKFFTRPPQDVLAPTTLSMARIDFKNDSFDTLLGQSANLFYNDIFVKLLDFNSNNRNFEKLKSIIFQILDENINIKTLTANSNNAVNGLQPSVIFDPNLETKIESLRFLESTNLDALYYYLNNKELKELKDSVQKSAFDDTVPSKFPVTAERLNDPTLKPTIIFLYNSIYSLEIVRSGSNYSVYRLKEFSVNDIFKEKIKLFNSCFVVLNKEPSTSEVGINFKNDFSNLTMNIPSKFLNRSVLQPLINISLDDL